MSELTKVFMQTFGSDLYPLARATCMEAAKKYGILWGSRCYAIGNLENSDREFVYGWRKSFTEEMQKLGVTVLSPVQTVFSNFEYEDESFRQRMFKLREQENFVALHLHMQAIRRRDLAMVDHSTFIVGVLDVDQPTYGTIEELAVAEKNQKPIFLVIKQGRKRVPFWIAGMLKPECIFDNLEQVIENLQGIAKGHIQISQNNWRIFKPEYIIPQI